MSEHNKTVVRQIIEDLWNDRNPELIDGLFTRNCTFHTPETVLQGRFGVRQLYDTYTSAFPDFRIKIEEIFAEGNKVMVRATFVGTQQGPLGDLGATGKTANIEAMVIFRVSGGKADDMHFMWDRLALMLPRCLVGIEACASSHHWSRELQALGNAADELPPESV